MLLVFKSCFCLSFWEWPGTTKAVLLTALLEYTVVALLVTRDVTFLLWLIYKSSFIIDMYKMYMYRKNRHMELYTIYSVTCVPWGPVAYRPWIMGHDSPVFLFVCLFGCLVGFCLVVCFLSEFSIPIASKTNKGRPKDKIIPFLFLELTVTMVHSFSFSEQRKLKKTDIPLLQRLLQGPSNSNARIFLMDKDTEEISSDVWMPRASTCPQVSLWLRISFIQPCLSLLRWRSTLIFSFPSWNPFFKD